MTLAGLQELAHNRYIIARRIVSMVNNPQYCGTITAEAPEVERLILAGDLDALEKHIREVATIPAEMTTRELRTLARTRKIPYYGRLDRQQLMQVLK